MPDAEVIATAEFDRKTGVYWMLSTLIVLCVTVVGIPIAVVWLFVGLIFTNRYLARMECALTTNTLKVGKGILTRVEKTIPLEKITDMAMVQGPIMRAMGLYKLTVETAGTSGPGALVALTGIVDAPVFREKVLAQRDRISGAKSDSAGSPSAAGDSHLAILGEIRDSLRRIEEKWPGTP
ncbi:MAG: PH domain-containing protein [Akkermansiaceae bacterium]|nr:PH domain-containing protein [Akkermansiaceae bacterium]NNM28775.1 PH domain-containing protein [Akkermansiaceae bacterium]